MDQKQQPLLERYRQSVDDYIRQLLKQYPSPLTTMVEYHLGWRDTSGQPNTQIRTSGKGIRPTLCMFTVDATGGDWTKTVPAAASLEILHNATLIHDDIQDADQLRHGHPTVWALWGVGQAINAGDTAFMLSSIAVRNLRDTGYPAQTVLEAEDLVTNACLRIMNGQERDLAFESRLNVSVEEYLEMIVDKTGVLIETSILMGALLGNPDKETKNHIQNYGQVLGRIFQISDDFLGIWGDIGKTGKSVIGADIKRKKKSYPIVYAFTHALPEDLPILTSLFQNRRELSTSEIETVLNIMSRIQVQEDTHRMLLALYTEAVGVIQQTSLPDWAKRDYIQLADFFVQRQF